MNLKSNFTKKNAHYMRIKNYPHVHNMQIKNYWHIHYMRITTSGDKCYNPTIQFLPNSEENKYQPMTPTVLQGILCYNPYHTVKRASINL